MDTLLKIAKVIINFLAVVAFFWGIGLLLQSITTPSGYRLYNASAVQLTQVYTEAMMYALQGCGLILVAIFIHIALNVGNSSSDAQIKAVVQNTARTNALLNNLGKILTKR